ncbi:2-amino-4-hydroxy-6-hydroxymethyldihydropteridine diphosphokinase [Candidatus Gracilibacteria bacterium]|nr:2-amino-4-hydroxy-6-hydroxymethyldihydropteridine diphosphokinase [Candidatus Gracilibacteria bacterium]
METKVYIALGTNLGDREKNLEIALEEIEKFATINQKSTIHETDPVGPQGQGKFLNMAVEITTELAPVILLVRLQEIEHKMGRTHEIKNGPRIIDLDILLYDNEIINQPNLKVPHPRMHKRAFVLEPLQEIAAEIIHPNLKQTIKELWTKLK